MIEQAYGTVQVLTCSEFFKLPLVQRVHMLSQRRVKFFKAGRQITATEALA